MWEQDLKGVIIFFLMIRRPPRSTQSRSSAASDVYKRQPEANHTIMLQAVLGQKLGWKDEVGAAYALAKEQEDIGNYDAAFAALKRGADIQRGHLRYDISAEVQNMTDVANAFTKEAFDKIPAGTSEDAPIFVVGMPRTGTTLVERILGNHRDVTPGGELNDFSMAMRAVINAHITQHPDRNLNPLSAALEADYSRMGLSLIHISEPTRPY
eukprot:TRINITY_DN9579_c0_g1_i1.p2 TRINITY_DN9579_c0_g1~~TRINITY_DN9579_c0_g1_i1.p2  ORF type:complete len:211 (-),score=82.15 TRINITY_DN9579_c0_g1_i1:111-743(-)